MSLYANVFYHEMEDRDLRVLQSTPTRSRMFVAQQSGLENRPVGQTAAKALVAKRAAAKNFILKIVVFGIQQRVDECVRMW